MTRGPSARRAAALLLPMLLPLPAQEAAASDDPAAILRTAIDHARYGARLAAARRFAGLGDAAIPALRAEAERVGLQAIPAHVVDALGTHGKPEPALLALLADWAAKPEFYWRSVALKGLVEHRSAAHRAMFVAALSDPSHLMRIQGARGLLRVGDEEDRAAAAALLEDPDPRVPVPVASALLEAGDERGVPLLEQALGWQDQFLGDPWGRREAQAALATLRRAFPERSFALPETAEAAAVPEHRGGIEIRSCRYGDLFLRWDADGAIMAGLRGGARAELDRATLQRLELALGALPGKPAATHGTIVCDFLQAIGAGRRLKAAPGAVPAELASWLGTLAAALERAPELARALRERLPQFVPAIR